MQGPPDVMPDGFSVIRFTALDQLGNLPPERIGNRAAIAADSVSMANTFGPVGIADTTSYQFEGLDFAVRAVREANCQRDPIESGVDRLDKRHLISALFQHPRLTPLAEQLLQHLHGMTALRKERLLLARSGHKRPRGLGVWASAAKAAGRSRTRNEQRLHVFAACH